MTSRIETMVASFGKLRSAQTLDDTAKKDKTSAWSNLMDAVAAAFVGADAAALSTAGKDIGAAYEVAYKGDNTRPATITPQAQSNLIWFAKAAAAGTYPKAVAAWEAWAARCEASKADPKTKENAGQKFQTLLYLLSNGYDLTLDGIVKMKNDKATDSKRILTAAIRALEAVDELDLAEVSSTIDTLRGKLPKETKKKRIVLVASNGVSVATPPQAPEYVPPAPNAPLPTVETSPQATAGISFEEMLGKAVNAMSTGMQEMRAEIAALKVTRTKK